MANIGRPPKVNIEDLLADVDAYISSADPPIVAEFAHRHNITRQYLYELAGRHRENGDSRLSDAIKRISEEKEIKLEKGALIGDYNSPMAIFSLKQLGWSDNKNIPTYGEQEQEDDPLTKSLKEFAGEYNANQ